MGAKISNIDKRFSPSPSAYSITQYSVGANGSKWGFGTEKRKGVNSGSLSPGPGAYDTKTRPECENKIQFGEATREEIIARFGDMNNEIWNCRHKWDELSSSPEDQGYNPKKFEDLDVR